MTQQNTKTLEIVDFCRKHFLFAEVVGSWVWVSFQQTPAEPVRKTLKEAGFVYSPRRQKWAHNCGKPTLSAYQVNPWEKYNHRIVSKPK